MLERLWQAVWAANTPSGRVVVVAIAFLLLRALAASARHLARYGRENRALRQVEARLQAERDAQTPPPRTNEKAAGNDEVETATSERRPPALVDADLLREGLDPTSLIGERLAAIVKLRTHQVKINLQTLHQLTLAREEARPGLTAPQFSAAMATLLGLLGTFIGLASMIQGIQFALPDDLAHGSWETWTQSMQNVFGVLAGIKTAFSSSLVGMFCAVVSTFLSARLKREQASFFQKLERFTTEDLLPATVPAVEDESLLESISLQLESSFNLLQEIYQQNRSALQDLTASEEALAAIIGEVQQITRNESSRNLDQVIKQLDQTNRSVLSVADQMPKLGTALESANRRMLERMSETLHSIAAQVERPALGTSGGQPALSWPIKTALAILGLFLALLLVRSFL